MFWHDVVLLSISQYTDVMLISQYTDVMLTMRAIILFILENGDKHCFKERTQEASIMDPWHLGMCPQWSTATTTH